MQFLLIAALVTFSYGCGVNQLYWYYAEQRLKDCEACVQDNKECTEKDCNCDRTLSKYVRVTHELKHISRFKTVFICFA